MRLQHIAEVPIFQGTTKEICLWWLGQAGFAIAGAGKRLLIDAYLSDSLARKYHGRQFTYTRMTPSPIDPQTLTDIDIVLCSHAHTDHMDPDTLGPLAANNSQMRVVVPRAAKNEAAARGVPPEQIVSIDAGESAKIGDVIIEATASAHEELEQNEKGQHHFLGFVVTLSGACIYHSGDCAPFPGLAEGIQNLRPDLALLPVNGRDAFRHEHGVPGNFTADEALELCVAAEIPIMIAHHWGMFDFNTVAAEDVQAAAGRFADRVRCLVPVVGECLAVDI